MIENNNHQNQRIRALLNQTAKEHQKSVAALQEIAKKLQNPQLEALNRTMQESLLPIFQRNSELMKSLERTTALRSSYLESINRNTELTNLSKVISEAMRPLQLAGINDSIRAIAATMPVMLEGLFEPAKRYSEMIQRITANIDTSLWEGIDFEGLNERIKQHGEEFQSPSEFAEFMYDEIKEDSSLDDEAHAAFESLNNIVVTDKDVSTIASFIDKVRNTNNIIIIFIFFILIGYVEEARNRYLVEPTFDAIESYVLQVNSGSTDSEEPFVQRNYVVANKDTALRNDANTESEILAIISSDSVLMVLEDIRYYYKVLYQSENGEELVGYIAKKNVSLIDMNE